MVANAVDYVLTRVGLRQQVGDDGLTPREREQEANEYLETLGRTRSDAEVAAAKTRLKAAS
jgi:hypothetical protein